jgi:curved DNA-binding protein
MKYKDYYQILGVSRDAKTEDIKKAYRLLARKYHPDVSKETGAEDKFKDANEAHDILSDPGKRAAYDQLGNFRPGQDFRPPPGWGGRSARSAGGDFAGMDFSDLFSQLFGGSHPSATRHSHGARGGNPQQGKDVEVKLVLSLEEAFHGAEKQINLSGPSGERTIKLRVPAGVLPGKRLRLAGKGHSSQFGGPAGDLYLNIEISPHHQFRLEGPDIYLDMPIAPWEAALGATVIVPTLTGSVRVKVGAGSRSGQKLRLAQRGMPTPTGAGDFFVQLMIVVPPILEEDERQLYEKLSALSNFDLRPDFPRE